MRIHSSLKSSKRANWNIFIFSMPITVFDQIRDVFFATFSKPIFTFLDFNKRKYKKFCLELKSKTSYSLKCIVRKKCLVLKAHGEYRPRLIEICFTQCMKWKWIDPSTSLGLNRLMENWCCTCSFMHHQISGRYQCIWLNGIDSRPSFKKERSFCNKIFPFG